ncbi:MAG TPA: hypothetical protein VGL25_07240 [Casimicrobiaceae bacterium]
MTIVNYRVIALGVVMLLFGGCAEKPIVPGQPKVANIDLAPYVMHEECVDLVQGDRLDYRFASNNPVKFFIYYRDSNMVVEPITREGVVEDAGVFAPRITARYCLSWEANAAGALIGYQANVRRAAK